MVSKILKFLNREIQGLHEAAYLLGFFAFASQLLALVRDRLLAHNFGAGSGLDIYYASFRIPDFVFITAGSLISISVLVPFLIERIEKNGDDGKRFVNSIFSFFSVFIIISSLVIFLVIPYLVKIIFPGISSPDQVKELISLTRILLLSPIFLGISNFLASITQVYKKFLIYALSPLFYNLGIIGGIIFLSPIYGTKGVVFGVIAGTIMHLLLQIISVYKEGIFPTFTLGIDWVQVKKVVSVSFPRTLALSSTHISNLFLIAFASVMSEGSIAIFSLAFNLQSVPLSIIGVSYSLAAFPVLSRYYINKEMEKFINQIVLAGRHIIFWSIPVSVLFIVLRAQIVRTILGSGQFSWTDTRLTAAAFALFAVSAAAQSVSLLFVRGYYSASKTKTPLVINLISSAITIILSFIFIKIYQSSDSLSYFFQSILKVEGLPGSSVLMLPLGFACGSIANAIILWFYFARDFRNISRPLFKVLFQAGSASIIMGAVAHSFLDVFDNIFDINTLVGIFLQGFLSGIIGIVVGIIVLKILHNEEIKVIWQTLRKKIWKSEIIQPETTL